jgi:hypothetical protein
MRSYEDEAQCDIYLSPSPLLKHYLNYLSTVRPEVGYLPLAQRQKVRADGIGDSGLAFLGYIALAGELIGAPDWQVYVDRLGQPYRHLQENSDEVAWEGDLMSRENSLWLGTVLISGRSGNLSVINQKASRAFMHEALRQVVGWNGPQASES